jgi:cytochrome d ubiquinol oxidase subunit II
VTTVWFVLIAGLWTGYLVLEGFDFGVGMLLAVLGRDARERGALLATIGPVWDGNEVWLITAGAATFAAFPQWYASLFSGFYLPLLLILVALIVRGVALEYRGKRDDPGWQRRWDAATVAGSAVPALLWGVALADIAHGVPLTAAHTYVGGPGHLLTPVALLGGAATLALCATHGALFLALKTTGALRSRARTLAGRLGVPAGTVLLAFLALTARRPVPVGLAALAVLTLAGALLANRAGRDGWAFTGTCLTIAATVATLFTGLYPYVLPSTLDPAGSLTVHNAAASPYTLGVMSWVAGLFAPLVLLYQGWTYWVFRRRVSVGS